MLNIILTPGEIIVENPALFYSKLVLLIVLAFVAVYNYVEWRSNKEEP